MQQFGDDKINASKGGVAQGVWGEGEGRGGVVKSTTWEAGLGWWVVKARRRRQQQPCAKSCLRSAETFGKENESLSAGSARGKHNSIQLSSHLLCITIEVRDMLQMWRHMISVSERCIDNTDSILRVKH